MSQKNRCDSEHSSVTLILQHKVRPYKVVVHQAQCTSRARTAVQRTIYVS